MGNFLSDYDYKFVAEEQYKRYKRVVKEKDDKIDNLEAGIAMRDASIYGLSKEINSLKRQIDERETLRCTGCGTPIETFFTTDRMKLDEFIYNVRHRKILYAVKQIRAELGCDLVTAKSIVETLHSYIVDI